MSMPRRSCHDDYPHLAQTGTPIYGGRPCKLDGGGLERAKAMLLAGQPVHVVALALGYSAERTFGHAFKTATGVRPGAFRKAAGVSCVKMRGYLHAKYPSQIRNREGYKPLPRYKRQRDPQGSTGT